MVKFAEPFDAQAFAARRPSFEDMNVRLLQQLPLLIQRWLPGGRRDGREYVVRNPRRADQRLGSFRINLENGKWADFATGESGGDPVSLYAFIQALSQYAALRELGSSEGHPPCSRWIAANPAKDANPAAHSDRHQQTQRAALRLYERAQSLLGTAAEAYLRRRGLVPSPAWHCLRFDKLPYRGSGPHPTLIAPVSDCVGRLTGIQRTYLDPTGLKLAVAEPKLSLGRVRGGAIHLAIPNDELFICEGLEDGLTLAQTITGACVWVAAGAGMMPSIAIPPHVRTVIIAADNDPAGEEAAQTAADRISSNAHRVRIIRPPESAKDFNEGLLQGELK